MFFDIWPEDSRILNRILASIVRVESALIFEEFLQQFREELGVIFV